MTRTLTIASKANQATSLPVLLVVSLVNEFNPKTAIILKFEEVEVLEASDSAVELNVGDGSPIYGSTNCLENLIQEYPFLSGKHDAHVSLDSCAIKYTNLQILNYHAGQRMDRPNVFFDSFRLQGCRRSSP